MILTRISQRFNELQAKNEPALIAYVTAGDPSPEMTVEIVAALERVIEACRKHGKTPGILSRPALVAQHKQLGFRFFALGSDTGSVISGLQQSLSAMRLKNG